jgi:hypothetical protein
VKLDIRRRVRQHERPLLVRDLGLLPQQLLEPLDPRARTDEARDHLLREVIRLLRDRRVQRHECNERARLHLADECKPRPHTHHDRLKQQHRKCRRRPDQRAQRRRLHVLAPHALELLVERIRCPIRQPEQLHHRLRSHVLRHRRRHHAFCRPQLVPRHLCAPGDLVPTDDGERQSHHHQCRQPPIQREQQRQVDQEPDDRDHEVHQPRRHAALDLGQVAREPRHQIRGVMPREERQGQRLDVPEQPRPQRCQNRPGRPRCQDLRPDAGRRRGGPSHREHHDDRREPRDVLRRNDRIDEALQRVRDERAVPLLHEHE